MPNSEASQAPPAFAVDEVSLGLWGTWQLTKVGDTREPFLTAVLTSSEASVLLNHDLKTPHVRSFQGQLLPHSPSQGLPGLGPGCLVVPLALPGWLSVRMRVSAHSSRMCSGQSVGRSPGPRPGRALRAAGAHRGAQRATQGACRGSARPPSRGSVQAVSPAVNRWAPRVQGAKSSLKATWRTGPGPDSKLTSGCPCWNRAPPCSRHFPPWRKPAVQHPGPLPSTAPHPPPIDLVRR